MMAARQGVLVTCLMAPQAFIHFLPTKKDPLQEGAPKETFLLLTKQPLFTLML